MTDSPAIQRRVGTAATFSAAMLSGLGRQPALDRFTERRTDDPSIALVDAWSAVLDVLTFYSERLANEGYLPTATESSSVNELAHAVGYQPARGRASATLLAFTLEEAIGAPLLVPIPVGTKVSSMPGPGQVPQNYETVEPLDARPAWNAIAARTRSVQHIGPGARSAYVEGLRADLSIGDAVLLVGSERENSDTAGEWAFRMLSGVELLPALGSTRLSWSEPLGATTPDPTDAGLFVLRRRAGVFGANAPDYRLIQNAAARPTAVQVTAVQAARPVTLPPIGNEILVPPGRPPTVPTTGDWPGWTVVVPGGADNVVDLDGLYPTATVGSWAVLSLAGVPEPYRVQAVSETSRTDYALTSRVDRLTLRGPSIRTRFSDNVRETSVWVGSELLALAEVPNPRPVQGDRIELARPIPTVEAGRTVVVRGPHPLIQVADGVRGLTVTPDQGTSLVLHAGELLEVAAPAVDNADGSITWSTTRGTVTAQAYQLVSVRPANDAEIFTEVATTAGPTADALVFAVGLSGCYDRESVRVSANIASATHGETRSQVLGSGNASTPYQTFKLSQTPLTYVAAPGGSIVSTLQVRVDGRLWTEVSQLFGTGPADEVYTSRADADGVTTVGFGDGLTGARLPTGTNNVTATYRIGTGLVGRVDAGQLTLPMSRPLGMKAVINPSATGLAADPEPADSVRANAPRAALTLDRVVSLQDVEDFAGAVAGIGKAHATRLWDGRRLIVHLTVTGTAGQDIDDQALQDLTTALLGAGDERMPLVVDRAERLFVPVAAIVFVAAGYDQTTVLAGVRSELGTALAIDVRDLAQPLTIGDILLAAHRVPGVEAVNVTDPVADVPALPARMSAGQALPAQIVALAANGLAVS
ncbi:hypothetical protein [Kribbella kalugense]|uniref:Putative phage baseplate assembly protein n=1 Tax=Kribbella kalugense TaxID=2512221 RepID=A0A4R7ZVF7_9ACTN|nr:hypothetical protein [Kribbella kalugense]TDW22087.1 putative phage baseplate assembly protein [Kribbella kalugense]